MSDNSQPTGSDGAQATSADGGQASDPNAQAGRPQLQVLAQFIRDLSFESPNAPKSLQSPGANPKLDLNIHAKATKRGEDLYEVTLNFDARGSSDEGVIYNIELVYAGLFRIANVPQSALQGVLFVDCPTLLFPFLRRIVAELTQEGGFPPLMLNPVDFAALYRQSAQKQQVAGSGQPAT